MNRIVSNASCCHFESKTSCIYDVSLNKIPAKNFKIMTCYETSLCVEKFHFWKLSVNCVDNLSLCLIKHTINYYSDNGLSVGGLLICFLLIHVYLEIFSHCNQ